MRSFLVASVLALVAAVTTVPLPVRAQQMVLVNDSVLLKTGNSKYIRTFMSESAMFAFVDTNNPDMSEDALPRHKLAGLTGDEIFEELLGKATPHVLKLVWLRMWTVPASTIDGIAVHVWIQYTERDKVQELLTETTPAKKGR